VFAAIFMLNSLWLAYLGTETSKAAEVQKTILDEAATPAPKAPPGAGSSATTPTPAGSTAPATPPASPPPAQSSNPAPTPAPPPK
jgi:hypothetical protein